MRNYHKNRYKTIDNKNANNTLKGFFISQIYATNNRIEINHLSINIKLCRPYLINKFKNYFVFIKIIETTKITTIFQ